MIRKSLPRTKTATFAVLVPSPVPEHQGMPIASGTGFFIDPAGFFLTANHVIENSVIHDIWLMQAVPPGKPPVMLEWPELVGQWPEYDLAVLKVDFAKNANKAFLSGSREFSYIDLDLDPQQEGAPVYSYGYPLPTNAQTVAMGGGIVGHVGLGPRTTSAIISSTIEMTRPVMRSTDPKFYVMDKAFNYGNSGGPIVNQESGRAFAVCVRFQPVEIPQTPGQFVMIPSLYGIGSSVANIAAPLAGMRGKAKPAKS